MIRRIANITGLLLLAFVVSTVAFSGIAYSDYRYEKKETIEIPPEDAELLQVVGSRSDIKLTCDRDAKDISVEILKVVKAEDEETAEKIAGEMYLDIIRDDGVLTLETKYPEVYKKKSIFKVILGKGPNLRMDLFITVPPELFLSIMTASGDVEVFDILEDIELSTASGDIEASDIKGELKITVASGDVETDNTGSVVISSASGDVTAEAINGDATISVTSGDIDLKAVGGAVEIRTVSADIYGEGIEGGASVKGTSGSIEFKDISGPVNIFTASGDIGVEADPGGRAFDYNLGTSNGSVSLIFKTILESGYVLKASTTTGHIEIELPIKVSTVSRNNIVGVVREGKSKVYIETSSGDISIKE